MKNHLCWIDLAKSIGLLMMILGHGSLVNDDLRCHIYSFHMPMFFTISGLLISNRGGEFISIQKNFKTLTIPYFCMNLLCLLFFSIMEFAKGELCFTNLKPHIFAILLGVGYNIGAFKPVCTAMWFFYATFIVKVLYAFLPNNRVSKLIQVVICIAIVKILTIYHINTYGPLDSAIMAYPFLL